MRNKGEWSDEEREATNGTRDVKRFGVEVK